MTLVTLRGAIPVYVQVDTEAMTITKVVGSDEEFTWRRDSDTRFLGDTGDLVKDGEVPDAYDESGDPLDDPAVVTFAHKVADNDPDIMGETIADWPAWSWGW